ncbi:hypothetical protein HMPREF1119_1018 [Haemophilus parainfluenzae HK2019]|jgi:hypothetical protein|uniref:Uncharacterized protein n=1 Tax=Haemophilus parainfluenzae HK2019 TaxID=1095746 RepID=A0ABN0ESU6_HAEPA|nr:hypothetical protein [Haemophilus parainfluenzae]EIJ28652.1 hypothetical protein HMPREF1119_1018 [Haemophilus parainfluenzae HK2019]OBX75022.1 hypothetical protein A9298_09705 [Haemophilus parainfluenzae]
MQDNEDYLFTSDMFNEYLNMKKIGPYCPCCRKDVYQYKSFGMEQRATVIKDGEIQKSPDENDNVGLGFIYTTIDAKGEMKGIRQGASGVFLFRCENCGFLRTFDAEFVKMEYKRLKREEQDKKE